MFIFAILFLSPPGAVHRVMGLVIASMIHS